MSDPVRLDDDGLPVNAVELAAQAMCCGRTRDQDCTRDGGSCCAQDLYGQWALQAISGLRIHIRRARRQPRETA